MATPGNLYKFLRSGDLGGFSAGAGVVKVKGAFGVCSCIAIRAHSVEYLYWQQNVLILSDPKALQYITHTTSYKFPRDREHTAIVHSVVGPGLVWADGMTAVYNSTL
jgi:hypothetical protein